MRNETIVRADTHANIPWFQVSRKLAQDSRLSFDHRGLMLYLLSKPANWRVSHQDIMREGNIGRDKTQRLIKELQEFGYVEYVNERNESGVFTGGFYRVYDLPELAPPTEPLKTRSPAEPDSGKTDTYSKESSYSKESVTEKRGQAPADIALDTLRGYYPVNPVHRRGHISLEMALEDHAELIEKFGVEEYLRAAAVAVQYKDIRYASNIEAQIVMDREKSTKVKSKAKGKATHSFTQEEQDFLKEIGF